MDRHSLLYQSDGQNLSLNSQSVDPMLPPSLHSAPSSSSIYQEDHNHGHSTAPHQGEGAGPTRGARVHKQIPNSGMPHSNVPLYRTIPNHRPLLSTNAPLSQLHSIQHFPQQLHSVSNIQPPQSTPHAPLTPHNLHAYSRHSMLPPTQSQPGLLGASHVPQLGSPQVPLRTTFPNPALGASVKQGQQSNTSPTEASPTTGSLSRTHSLSNGGRIISATGTLGGNSSGNASTQSIGAAGNSQPAKDASGKFPCPHCHKTYLHLKHLKRHLLRHTGDRPYQCVLCKDTFSRSDILKRHFQKCCIRRGNPGNLTHLTHAHDHQKKKNKTSHETATNPLLGTDNNNEAANSEYTSKGDNEPSADDTAIGNGKKTFGRSCNNCDVMKAKCDMGGPCGNCLRSGVKCQYIKPKSSNQVSRKEGTFPSDFGSSVEGSFRGMDNRESFNFPPPTHPHAHLQQQGLSIYQGQTQAGQSHLTRASPANSFSQSSASSYPSIGSNLHSSSFEEPFVFPSPHEPPMSQVQHHQQQLSSSHSYLSNAKSLPDSKASNLMGVQQDQSLTFFPQRTSTQPHQSSQDLGWNYTLNETYYPHVAPNILGDDGNGMFGFGGGNLPISIMDDLGSSWQLPSQDPIQAKCDHLISLLFPDCSSPVSAHSGSAPSNMSTLQQEDEDLKPWFTPDNVYHLIDSYRNNFQFHFPLIHFPSFNINSTYDGLLATMICVGAVYSNRGITVLQVRRLMDKVYIAMNFGPEREAHFNGPTERVASSEEIQARILFAILSTWHGNITQRERNRNNFQALIDLSRSSNFFKPITSRNCGPIGPSIYHQVDDSSDISSEFRWGAWIEQEKRNRAMFGVYLLDTVYVIYFNANPRIGLWDLKITLPADDGAWDAPDAASCMDALGLNGEEACRARNSSGTRMAKQAEHSATLEDILTPGREFREGTTNVYGKFILIHAVHVYIWKKQKQFGTGHHGRPDFGSPIPVTPYDRGVAKSGSSGGLLAARTTHQPPPVRQQKSAEVLRFNHKISQALEKYKKAWDADLAAQYPNHVPRTGFCRDGVAFYWLAVLFVRQKKRDLVLRSVGDKQMVHHVKMMLEAVNKRPHPVPESGGVNEIHDAYGMDELAFDMKLLFRPLDEATGSPRQSPPDTGN